MSREPVARRGFVLLALAVTCIGPAAGRPGAAAAPPSSAPKPAADGYDFSEVTAFAERAYQAAELPGAALQIYQGEAVVYERFLGEYDETTQVPIASASKWLSAAVILSLVDEGKLDLDAPAGRYLPSFTGKKGAITVRQMYSHTSGLSDFPGEWDYGITIAEYADQVAREGVLGADPGTEVRYGSAGMQVGGRVAEVVSGKGWNQLFEERIAQPCGMTTTVFARTDANRNPMLAGGAWSTLRDYGRFLEMLLDEGVCRGRRVLSEAAVREMQTDQTKALPLVVASNDRRGRQSHYGLGSWIDEQDAQGRTLQVSSPGAFGFRPWINLPRRLYGVWMVRHPRRLGQQPAIAPPPSAYDPWDLLDLVHQAVDKGERGR